MSDQTNTQDNGNTQNQNSNSVEPGLAEKKPVGDDVQIEGGEAGKYDENDKDVLKEGKDANEYVGTGDHELPSESTESEFAHSTAAQKDNDAEDEGNDKNDSTGI